MEVLGGYGFEGLEIVDAGVVHQNVHLAVGGFGLGEESRDVGGFGDVGLHGDGFAALGCDVLHNGVGAGFAAGVIDDDGSAFGCQMFGDGGADSLGGSGNYRYFSSEFAHFLFPLIIRQLSN